MSETEVVTEPEAREKAWHEDLAVKVEQAKAKFFDAINNGVPVPFHPLADAFPFMADEEITAISESIRADGLRNPIVIDIDGNIVDGRNRYMAILQLECKVREGYMADTTQGSYPLVNMKAKTEGQIQSIVAVITPEYRYRNKYGEQLKRFILSENMDRRHLSTSQKAGLAVLVADQPESLHKKDVLERFAIGGTIYREAKKIRETDEDLFNSVIRGELTVSEAMKALKAKEEPEQPEDTTPGGVPGLDPAGPTKPVDDIVNPPTPKPAPETQPDETPATEPNVKPEPEKKQPTKEEQITQLRWERDLFCLEESYIASVIGALQKAEEKIAEDTKSKYDGTHLNEKEYADIFKRTQQTIFGKLWEIKDTCNLEKTKTEKVLGETVLHK